VDNVIDGVVITFADIDTQKCAQEKLEQLASELDKGKKKAKRS